MDAAPPPGPMGVPAVWNAVARGYAADITPFFGAYAEEALRLAPVDASSHVLDVASGPGTLTFLAAQRAARVYAVDFSLGMLEELRTRAERDAVRNVQAEV